VHVADLSDPLLHDVIFHSCDVTKTIELDIPRAPFAIFNLAATHRTPGHELDEYYETNVIGAINIIKWAESVDCLRIFFTSSISVYGPDYEVKDENSELNPIHAYGKSKLMAEEVFQVWLRNDKNRKLVICRPAVIFGQGERGNFTRLSAAISRGRFIIPGSRKVVKASGYVKDLVRSTTFVINQERPFVLYNFAFPKDYSIGEIASSLASIGKYKKPPQFNLKFILPLLPRFGPLASVRSRIQKLLLPTRIRATYLEAAHFKWNYDLHSALSDWHRTSEFDLRETSK